MSALNSVVFSCAKLPAGKSGILRPDADGYYRVILGGLNVYNSVGHYYPFDSARQLFKESSQLMRRIKRGALRGEMGHPKWVPGMTDDQFSDRCLMIDERNVCVHIAEVELDQSMKDDQGRPCIGILGKIRPSGPMGAALQAQLDNPKENVCFSIRSFTDNRRVGRVMHRNLVNVVTWDAVNEPGISFAEKYKSPALESHLDSMIVLDDRIVTRGSLERVMQKTTPGGISHEATILNLNELFGVMGWTVDQSRKPGWSGW